MRCKSMNEYWKLATRRLALGPKGERVVHECHNGSLQAAAAERRREDAHAAAGLQRDVLGLKRSTTRHDGERRRDTYGTSRCCVAHGGLREQGTARCTFRSIARYVSQRSDAQNPGSKSLGAS